MPEKSPRFSAEHSSKYWTNVSDVYDKLYISQWSKTEDGQTRQSIERIIDGRQNISVLDIGCGTGLSFFLLKSIGIDFEYVGLDSSVGMLKRLKEKYPMAKTILADANDVDTLFSFGRFDLVLGINTAMSFCGDIEANIEKISAITKSGGVVFLSYLNTYSLRRLLSVRLGAVEQFSTRGAEGSLGATVATTVKPQRLRSLFQEHGFENVRVSTQSVLGGVWEADYLIGLERLLHILLPQLGHSVNVSAGRK